MGHPALRLQRGERNGGSSRPNALTGVVDENGVRHASYTYDSSGRVIAEERAGGVDRYRLAYAALPDGCRRPSPIPSATVRVHRFGMVTGAIKPLALDWPCTACGGIAKGFTYDANGSIGIALHFNGRKTCYAANPRATWRRREWKACSSPRPARRP